MKHNLNLVTDPRFAWRTRRFSGYDIPPQEVAELYKLYTQTGGPSWINHTNWFANKQCATWFGLTVAGGRVTQIALPNNNLAGTLGGFQLSVFSSLAVITLYGNLSLTGNIGHLVVPPLVRAYYIRSLPGIAGWPDLSNNISMRVYDAFDNAYSEADVDGTLMELYETRMLRTWAGVIAINLSGSNSAPSGVYQDSAAPSSGLEYVYKLVNDPDGEGFKKLTVTVTGSAQFVPPA